MAKKFGDKLDDLDLTNDEVKRLSECMKDKKFMDLLKDYALEISDPENKRKYEEEIAMMEGERGNDVKFINPTAGYVLKTTCNGQDKCFINICTSTEVGQPSCKPSMQNSSKGMNWSVPHSLAQPRDDTDRSSKKCIVYDVVFHPDTCHMAEKNSRFRQMIENIALDAVERNFSARLDKVNVKRPKMKYKGMPQTSIIRVPRKDEKTSLKSQDPNDPLAFPYPPMSKGNDKSKNLQEYTPHQISIADAHKKEEFVEPKYNLVHRGYFDIKNYYAMSDQTVASTRPRELVLNIELPMLKSAEPLELEISENRVYLECSKPVKYKLDYKLPFPVDDTKGCAKFEKGKKRLIITLEVLAPVLPNYKISPKGGKVCDAEETEQSSVVNDEQAPSSSHPSGLVHMESKCRHENHGLLWDHGYDENSKNNEPSPLSLLSPSLIKILLDETSKDESQTNLKKIRPRLTFHQNDEFITFIIHVKNIDSDKLWYTVTFSDIKFSCMTEKTGEFEEVYQLYTSFNGDDKIDPQRSRIDVSDDNAVFVLRKHRQSLYEWQNFKAGFDEEDMVMKSFLTKSNVDSLFSKVHEDVSNDKYESPEYQIIVKSENPKMLALKLSPKDREKLKLHGQDSSDINDLIDMLNKLDNLDQEIEANDEIKSNNVTSLKGEKKIHEDVIDTDEDDSSSSDSAESEQEDDAGYDPPQNMSLCKASQMQKTNGNVQKNHEQPTSAPTPTRESHGDIEAGVVNGNSQKNHCNAINEALIVREHEKGNEVKSQVYTDHKTKSVVTLNNNMLFEIDSD